MKKSIQHFSHRTTLLGSVLGASLFFAAASSHATNYVGNGASDFGGAVGGGILSVADDGANITFTLQRGSGNLNDVLVLYIDSVSGGFSDTSGFTDTGGADTKAIAGFDGSNRSLMTFAGGFQPEYAVAIKSDYADLFSLANNTGFTYITGGSQSGSSSPTFTLTISVSQIGLTNGVPGSFKIFGTYISNGGYRSLETVAGTATTAIGEGWNPFTQTSFVTYSFDAGATPTYPVTFQVDMTAQILSGAFQPNNGDTVTAFGSFGTGAQLIASGGNTNVYTGIYQDGNAVGTVEQYKYKFHSVANNNDVTEDSDNRPFTLQSGGQTLLLVYFSDVYPIPSAATNNLTFSIDMTPQIAFGHFNPANGDQVEVFGTLGNPKWTAGVFILTNNPTGANTNLYSGTYPDGNYPGTYEQYKFVIVAGGSTLTYESIPNRSFTTPGSDFTFPLAYFNNITSAYAIPVTFQVDMTVPLAVGSFNPGNGDTVTAAGTFQTNQWTAGVFVLTNNPSGTSPNIYSGTYVDLDAPGTGEQFKFQINSGGNANWESVANRSFILSATAQTLPAVIWNNQSANDILLQDTMVTFSVSMTNAVDTSNTPFNPSGDFVFVNGDFAGWVAWNPIALSSMQCQNNPPGSEIYTYQTTFAKGSSRLVNYKYSINGSDNEAAMNQNHVRYIRGTGNAYNFPLDIFGNQLIEPKFGKLTVAAPTGGNVPVTWLGYPGVHLQTTTSLTGPWHDEMGTDGQSSTNWPVTSGAVFFRLAQPNP